MKGGIRIVSYTHLQKQFLEKLKGITDPEEKRKTIGTEFYKVFWDKIREEADGGFFAQGLSLIHICSAKLSARLGFRRLY